MGASGAGKTTLLNIIACRVPFTSDESKKKVGVAYGKIYANDIPYNFQIFGDFANYVMQEDVLLQSLTVR
jgi:ABC-type lipoprotein export system ATPase subunit